MVCTNSVACFREAVGIWFTRSHEGTKKAVFFRREAPPVNLTTKFGAPVDWKMALRAKANFFVPSWLRVNQKNSDVSIQARRR